MLKVTTQGFGKDSRQTDVVILNRGVQDYKEDEAVWVSTKVQDDDETNHVRNKVLRKNHRRVLENAVSFVHKEGWQMRVTNSGKHPANVTENQVFLRTFRSAQARTSTLKAERVTIDWHMKDPAHLTSRGCKAVIRVQRVSFGCKQATTKS